MKYGDETRPGDGVTIGVMDSGIDRTHGEFSGASLTKELLQGLPQERRTDYGEREFSHGTAVTSIMAAQPNDAGFLGIAYGADFKVFGVPIGAHIPENDPRRMEFDWTQAYRDVLRRGVDIVNNSYSASGTFIENYNANELRLFSESTVIAQSGVANPAIFVWAAGNDHGVECDGPVSDENCVVDPGSPTGFSHRATSPNVVGGAMARLSELRGHNVVVVATDQSGVIAGFSNRCGIADQWCIAAPGVNVTGAFFGDRTPPPD